MAKAELKITEPPKLLENSLMIETMVFIFPVQHFLFEKFDQKLQQYIEADLINYNNRPWLEDIKRKMKRADGAPFAVLTFGELKAGFVVSLAPLVISILVFGTECLFNLRHLPVVLSLFKTLFEAKDSEQKSHCKFMQFKISVWQEVLRITRQMEENVSKKKPYEVSADEVAEEAAEMRPSLEEYLLEIDLDE